MPHISPEARNYMLTTLADYGHRSYTRVWVCIDGNRNRPAHTVDYTYIDSDTRHATAAEALDAAISDYERAEDHARDNEYVQLRYINYGGSHRTLTDRYITEGKLPSPCTFAGSFKRELNAWSRAGCAISQLLQDPSNHSNRDIDYIAARNGLLSYLPKGKPHTVNDDGTWSRQGRQEGKPGRVVQKILTPEARALISDADLATFGDHTRAAGLLEAGEIQIVSGDAIADWYGGYAYAPGNSPLQNSCMRGKDAHYFELYSNHPEQCRMAIYSDHDSRLLGRALIWNTDEGFTFMDRIYGDDDIVETFKTYAREQGWYHRATQTYDQKDSVVTPEGKYVYRTMRVSLPRIHSVGKYPYVDTFTYLNTDGGYITNDVDDDDCDYSLHSLYGERIDHHPRNRVTCYYCNERLDPDDCQRDNDGDALCDECWNEHYISCDRCGETESNDDARQVPGGSYYCQHCFDRYCITCADCDAPEWQDEAGVNASDDHVCRSCAENYTYCDDCETTVTADTHNGDRCESCQRDNDNAEADEPAPVVTSEETHAEADAMFDRVGIPAPADRTIYIDGIPHTLTSSGSTFTYTVQTT